MTATYTNPYSGITFVSEYAFSEALTREETKDLRKAYSAAGMVQFHSMNAATLELQDVSWFYSYYTAIVGAYYHEITECAYLFVQPFVWDTIAFANSRTTNRQTNRWLRERGFNVTVQDLRTVYNNAKHGNASYPLTMDDGTLVIPRFNYSQQTIDNYGNHNNERHCNEVPYLIYPDDASALVVCGKLVTRGNECSLVRC